MASEVEFLTTYESIKISYQNTLSEVDRAIDLEQHGDHDKAIVIYRNCLELIRDIFELPVAVPENIDNVKPEWNETCRTIQKLKDLRCEIEKQLRDLCSVDYSAKEAIDQVQRVGSDEETAEPAAKKRSDESAQAENLPKDDQLTSTKSYESPYDSIPEEKSVEANELPEALPEENLPNDTSQQVSKHIVTAADFIAKNLIKGAGKTGELVEKTTPYIISKLEAAPEDKSSVSPTVQTSVEVAKTVTSAAAGATSWVADKIGSAALATGRYLGPHIQTQAANILQKGFGYDSTQANSHVEGAFTLAAGAVEGISTVYSGLETSAKILGVTLSESSVKIIEQKYGKDAGKVAAGTFESVGNAFVVSRNVNYITPKGIAKGMAKNTGKAVVDDYKRALRSESHMIPAGDLTTDMIVSQKE